MANLIQQYSIYFQAKNKSECKFSGLVCTSQQNTQLITGHWRCASVTAIFKKSAFCTLC